MQNLGKAGLVQGAKWMVVLGWVCQSVAQVRVGLVPSLVPWAAPNSRPGAKVPPRLASEGEEGRNFQIPEDGEGLGDNGWGGAHQRAEASPSTPHP